MNVSQTYKEPDWESIAHLFKLGIAASLMALIGGDMLLGWGTVDETLAGMEQYLKDGIRDYHNPVVFWHGENEPYPVKSARLLKKYLPQMKKRVFKGMGHGQMLHEHTRIYAERLKEFLEGRLK